MSAPIAIACAVLATAGAAGTVWFIERPAPVEAVAAPVTLIDLPEPVSVMLYHDDRQAGHLVLTLRVGASYGPVPPQAHLAAHLNAIVRQPALRHAVTAALDGDTAPIHATMVERLGTDIAFPVEVVQTDVYPLEG